MQRTGLLPAVISLILSSYLAGQEQPKILGVWEMDASRSESAHQATPIGPVTLIIEGNANQLTIDTRKENDRKQPSSEKLTYKLDGSESSTVNNAGLQIKAKAHWDGPKLVTETARNVQGSTVTTMCVFSVDPGGNELTVHKSLTVQHGYQFRGRCEYRNRHGCIQEEPADSQEIACDRAPFHRHLVARYPAPKRKSESHQAAATHQQESRRAPPSRSRHPHRA